MRISVVFRQKAFRTVAFSTLYFGTIFAVVLSSFIWLVPLYAGQERFSKTIEGKEVNFLYQLTSPLSAEFSELAPINFSLDSKALETAHGIIPKLSVLQETTGKNTTKLANEIANKYLGTIHNAYTQHVASQKDAIAQARLPEGLTILLDCPEKAVHYSFTFNNTSQSYFHNMSTKTCAIRNSNTQSITLLKKRIKEDVDRTAGQLAHGSIYRFIDKQQNGYSFKVNLSAPSNAILQEYKTLIEASKQRIVQMTNEFESHQQYATNLYTQLSKREQIFFNSLKPLITPLRTKIRNEVNIRNRELYKQNYLLLVEKDDNYLIQLDYKAIVEVSKDSLQPVAMALKDRTEDRRRQINAILHFLQSIPYNTLQGRDIENYSGFLTPLALLDKNKGDCDSKSVAFIALMNILLPDIPTVMVLIDKHAFVAIGLEPQTGETSFSYDGTTYVAVEAVGPAISAIGNISEESKRAIARNAITQVIRIN